jgi:hypothetical protein
VGQFLLICNRIKRFVVACADFATGAAVAALCAAWCCVPLFRNTRQTPARVPVHFRRTEVDGLSRQGCTRAAQNSSRKSAQQLGSHCWSSGPATLESCRRCAAALEPFHYDICSRFGHSIARSSCSSHGWCFGRHRLAACLLPCTMGLLACVLPSDVWSLSLVRQRPRVASHKTEKSLN